MSRQGRRGGGDEEEDCRIKSIEETVKKYFNLFFKENLMYSLISFLYFYFFVLLKLLFK